MPREFGEGPSQKDKEFKAPKTPETPPLKTIENNQTNPINMPEVTPIAPNEEKKQNEREAFDKRMSRLANELKVPKDDILADYADEEHAAREVNPEDPSAIYEHGAGSKTVERLIIEKIKAGRDSLTGINNRSSFDKEMERRQKEVKRNGEFSMIMIDIDKFKSVNDTYGHLAGDYVLKEVATILSKTMRQGDFLGRIGGEEMVVLTSADNDAVEFAERLRKVIENTKFIFNGEEILIKNELGKSTQLTISAGVSPYDGSFEKMKENSDIGLYLAKGAGEKLTKNVKVETRDANEPTRNQVWYFDKKHGEFKKNK